MAEAEDKICELFDELVPLIGKADTVAGEIVRAISRIGYRNYNDGDHIGVGYGKETCNPAARYLIANCNDKVIMAVRLIWGEVADSRYNAGLLMLEEAVLEYIEEHPELKTTINNDDMWNYRNKNEDVNDFTEDDGWW